MLLLGFMGFIILIGLMNGFKLFLKKPEVKVPDVNGLPKKAAIKTLKGSGLKFQITYQDDLNLPIDTVIIQKPSPGAIVKKGRNIQLYLSRGFGNIEVPDLTSQDLFNAELVLEESNLKMGNRIKIRTNYVAKGLIVAQNPEPKSIVSKGASIDLIINEGSKDRNIYVNNFVGQRIEFVSDFRNNIPLLIENEIDTMTFGIITDQSLPLGTIVNINSPISFDFNPEYIDPNDTEAVPIITHIDDPEPMRDHRYIYFLVPPGFAERTLDVFLITESTREKIFHGKVKPGSKFEKIIYFPGSQTGLIYFYLDGKLEDYKRL